MPCYFYLIKKNPELKSKARECAKWEGEIKVQLTVFQKVWGKMALIDGALCRQCVAWEMEGPRVPQPLQMKLMKYWLISFKGRGMVEGSVVPHLNSLPGCYCSLLCFSSDCRFGAEPLWQIGSIYYNHVYASWELTSMADNLVWSKCVQQISVSLFLNRLTPYLGMTRESTSYQDLMTLIWSSQTPTTER